MNRVSTGISGSNPELVGKIMIFQGWKTMQKNPEITWKFQELVTQNFRVPGSDP